MLKIKSFYVKPVLSQKFQAILVVLKIRRTTPLTTVTIKLIKKNRWQEAMVKIFEIFRKLKISEISKFNFWSN